MALDGVRNGWILEHGDGDEMVGLRFKLAALL